MSLEILHQSFWSRSALGKAIELHSCLRPSQRPILFIGGVHGDEPEGVKLAEQFLIWLQKNNKSDFHSWILIPCLNPDGFHNQDRVNGRGVDLNRNFPSPDWTSKIKAPRYNPGPHPASEPEVQSLCRLVESSQPQVIIHFHSWKACVVYTGITGKTWAEKIAGNSGYSVREDIGYPTPGSLGQYAWLKFKIPVVCVEEEEKSDLEKIWPRFAKGLEKVLTRDQGSSQ